jgi:hypothetical protein
MFTSLPSQLHRGVRRPDLRQFVESSSFGYTSLPIISQHSSITSGQQRSTISGFPYERPGTAVRHPRTAALYLRRLRTHLRHARPFHILPVQLLKPAALDATD